MLAWAEGPASCDEAKTIGEAEGVPRAVEGEFVLWREAASAKSVAKLLRSPTRPWMRGLEFLCLVVLLTRKPTLLVLSDHVPGHRFCKFVAAYTPFGVPSGVGSLLPGLYEFAKTPSVATRMRHV